VLITISAASSSDRDSSSSVVVGSASVRQSVRADASK
jgi:hypothetical protein